MSNSREELIFDRMQEVEKLLPDGIEIRESFEKLLGGKELPPVILALCAARNEVSVETASMLPKEINWTMFDIVLMSAMLGWLEGRRSGISKSVDDYMMEHRKMQNAGSEG